MTFVDINAVIALVKDSGEDAQPDSEYRRACDDLVEALSEQAIAPQTHLVHVGFQWRARASIDDLWSPWRDGPCPALAPKGSETEERRVYALTSEGSANG